MHATKGLYCSHGRTVVKGQFCTPVKLRWLKPVCGSLGASLALFGFGLAAPAAAQKRLPQHRVEAPVDPFELWNVDDVSCDLRLRLGDGPRGTGHFSITAGPDGLFTLRLSLDPAALERYGGRTTDPAVMLWTRDSAGKVLGTMKQPSSYLPPSSNAADRVQILPASVMQADLPEVLRKAAQVGVGINGRVVFETGLEGPAVGDALAACLSSLAR